MMVTAMQFDVDRQCKIRQWAMQGGVTGQCKWVSMGNYSHQVYLLEPYADCTS